MVPCARALAVPRSAQSHAGDVGNGRVIIVVVVGGGGDGGGGGGGGGCSGVDSGRAFGRGGGNVACSGSGSEIGRCAGSGVDSDDGRRGRPRQRTG